MDNNILYKYRTETEFSVSHGITTKWVMPDYHFHDVFEIYLTLTDGVRYFVKDRLFELKRGDLMVFNNMDLHKSLVSPESVYERYVVLFKPEFVQDMSTNNTDLLECFLNRSTNFPYVLHLDDGQLDTMLNMFEKADFYCNSCKYGNDIYRKLILCEILLFINELYRNIDIMVNSVHDGEYKRVRPIIQYIHGNLDSNLSLLHLSEKFFISTRHMGHLFKKVTGFTVNEYIIKLRIIKASELLKSNISVSRAGELAGFNNLSHFIRTFKAYMGKSPKQYSLTYNEA